MKSETYVFIGVLVYFATLVLNRFLAERNYNSLTPEDRLKLTDGFSRHRSLATYIPIGIMLLAVAVGKIYHQATAIAFPLGVAMVLILSFVLQLAILRRLKELSLPEEYRAKFGVQSALVQIGNVVAMGTIAYGVVAGHA